MGWASNKMIELELKRQEKYEQFLDTPEIIVANAELTRALTVELDRANANIDQLIEERERADATAWKVKLVDWLCGGAVGAVCASALSAIMS